MACFPSYFGKWIWKSLTVHFPTAPLSSVSITCSWSRRYLCASWNAVWTSEQRTMMFWSLFLIGVLIPFCSPQKAPTGQWAMQNCGGIQPWNKTTWKWEGYGVEGGCSAVDVQHGLKTELCKEQQTFLFWQTLKVIVAANNKKHLANATYLKALYKFWPFQILSSRRLELNSSLSPYHLILKNNNFRATKNPHSDAQKNCTWILLTTA